MLSMDMMELMSGFDRDCKTAGNIADLETVIVQAFQSLCVKTLSYFHHPPFNEIDGGPSQLVLHFGFPDAWVEKYNSSAFSRDDPVIKYVMSRSGPLWWDEPLSANEENSDVRNLINSIVGLGVRNGLSFPVFELRLKSGYFALGFEKRKSEISEQQITALQWACQVAHQRYVELMEKGENALDRAG